MTPIQIIGSIMAATGKGIITVASEHSCSKMTFYRVINGKSKNPDVRAIITDLIKKPESEIWPEAA